jgi:hypothetical protein
MVRDSELPHKQARLILLAFGAERNPSFSLDRTA